MALCLAPGWLLSRAQEETGFQQPSAPAPALPAPLTPSAFQGLPADLVSPRALLATAPGAILDQLHTFPKEWGQGSRAFEKRAASLYAQFVIGDVIERSVQAIDHEQRGYRRRGAGAFFPRMGHIILNTVTAQRADGSRLPAYATMANDYGSWALATLWCPRSLRTPRSIFGWGTGNVGMRAAGNFVKEFWPDVKGLFSRSKPQTP